MTPKPGQFSTLWEVCRRRGWEAVITGLELQNNLEIVVRHAHDKAIIRKIRVGWEWTINEAAESLMKTLAEDGLW